MSGSSWNAKMISRYILERFDVSYSNLWTIRLAYRLGFSVRKPRPAPYNSATPEEQREFIKEGKAATTNTFDGLDKMRDAIRQMIHNGEIPIVKMFVWMLAA